MSILIVEDNETSAKIVEITLKKEGYQTERAINGLEALEKLKANPGFRLIITDIMMPEMDGLALLKAMKAVPAYSKIPVIMCTSLSDADRVREAAIYGCRHYLVKPFRARDLIRRVRESIKDENKIIMSRSEIMRQYGLDQDAYCEIASQFRDLLEQQVALLESKESNAPTYEAPLDLNDVLESANLFGAERLVVLLSSQDLSGDADESDSANVNYHSLLHELKAALEAISSSLPAAVPSEEDDEDTPEQDPI